MSTVRSRGVVKFFNADKGFGFCRRDGGLPDVFIHSSVLKRADIWKQLQQGDELEFDVVPMEGKGPRADNVRLISKP